MRMLLLGSTGLLGQAMARRAHDLGWSVVSASRHGSDFSVDITDDVALRGLIAVVGPDIVVNCTGLTDIGACERDASLAYRVNARPVSLLAEWSSESKKSLIHVSTDHFFPAGGNCPHDERAKVTLVNEYARSKFAGEAFALTAPLALVLRTSIIGIRGWDQRTFAEWVLDSLRTKKRITAFSDAWTSSIDVTHFASAALELAERGATGLFNLASNEVFSKEQLIREFARQLGTSTSAPEIGSIASLSPGRPGSLGLDVSKAERYLSESLPGMESVVASVLAQEANLEARCA